MTSLSADSSTLIEGRLQELLPVPDTAYAPLMDAARHCLLGGGKRLRPQLVLEACQLLGGRMEEALDPACAIEMVHCYSLIHDDLPCMDDDDYRRGRPTVHRAFSEALAVLAGDHLLTRAFEVLGEARSLGAEAQIRLVRVLAQAAGGHGMIAGQVLDIQAEGHALDEAALRQIHQLKTGAMITAAVECGGICARASETDYAGLKHFAAAIGLAFQVIDDVLDVTNAEKKGRASDLENEKATYVALLGLEGAQNEADRLFSEAMTALDSYGAAAARLRSLSQKLVYRKT